MASCNENTICSNNKGLQKVAPECKAILQIKTEQENGFGLQQSQEVDRDILVKKK